MIFQLFFIASLLSSCWAGEFQDATGISVQVNDHPSRIVALAPSVAELAAEILSMDLQKIVGVSESTDFPPALKSVTSVGPYTHVNIEKVSLLRPDLVLATTEGNSKDQVLRLRELGIPVFVVATSNFAQIQQAMVQVAELLGEKKRGETIAKRFAQSLEVFRARAARRAHNNRIRVMVQLDDAPLVVAGGKSFLSEALETIGAQNVFGETTTSYPRPSLEEVLRRDPDSIVVLAFGADLAPFNRMASRWGAYQRLRAIREKRVRVFFSDTLLRPSLRLLEGLAELERVLYAAS